jgi:hypothetical protein
MIAWWDSLRMIESILALVAVPATLLLVIQTVMLIIGMNGGADIDDGGDISFDGSQDGGFDVSAYDSDAGDLVISEAITDPGLAVFTVRGFVSFFTVFGWLGLALMQVGFPDILAIVIAVMAGIGSMVLTAYAFVWMMKLQHSGNVNMKNAIGHSGNVYIRIPAGRKTGGKITLVLQGKFSEVDAITNEDADLKPGEEIIVIGVSNHETVIVTRKKQKLLEQAEQASRSAEQTSQQTAQSADNEVPVRLQN